jgi:hypothetical protein
MSAEDGAVDALLWRDEVSVDVALVVLEAPLALAMLAQLLSGVKMGPWQFSNRGTTWKCRVSMGRPAIAEAAPRSYKNGGFWPSCEAPGRKQ